MAFIKALGRIVGADVLAAVLPLAGCSRQQAELPPPRPVRAAQVPAAGELAAQQHYAARIEARHETVLAFQVGGRVSARQAEVGNVVAAGAVLARMDSSDLRLRERDLAARLAASRAERADAASALRRAIELRPKGFVSQADFDRATYRDQAAAAQVEALTAQLGLASRDLAYAALTAPAAGVITARMIEAGQVVSAGQPAFSLAQVGQIEQQVVDKIKRKLQDTPYLKSLISTSKPGEAWIWVNLENSLADPKTKVPDIWYQVRKKVGDIRDTLPPGVQGPYFNDEFGDVYPLVYGI